MRRSPDRPRGAVVAHLANRPSPLLTRSVRNRTAKSTARGSFVRHPGPEPGSALLLHRPKKGGSPIKSGTTPGPGQPLCASASPREHSTGQIVDGDVHRSRNAARQKHQHAGLHDPLANDGSRSAAAALFAEKFYRRSIYWQSSEMDDSASRLITKVYAFAESRTVAAAQIARDKRWSL